MIKIVFLQNGHNDLGCEVGEDFGKVFYWMFDFSLSSESDSGLLARALSFLK